MPIYLFAIGYVFAAFGLAYVVGHSKITLSLRERWAIFCGEGWVCYNCKRHFPSSDMVNRSLSPGPCANCHAVRWFLAERLHPAGYWLLDLIECPACFGYWLGAATGSAVGFLLWRTFWPVLGLSFFLAFFTTGTNFALGRLTGLIRSE